LEETDGTTYTADEVVVVIVTTGAEDTGGAVVVTVTEAVGVAAGRLNETPAEAQRPEAAAMVFARSSAEQAFWTHGVKAVMKPEALQIHAISVGWQPVLPKLEMAQVRAHCGIESS